MPGKDVVAVCVCARAHTYTMHNVKREKSNTQNVYHHEPFCQIATKFKKKTTQTKHKEKFRSIFEK